jgi:hypothetical protein
MSNPTSNFNWQMPTNTDLVSQLPADFEVFGQAVDTSLADLKGGTTGQVLKKNSNTDMDFVWGADSAGMTNPMTTTGDMIYSSSGSTPARLGIGTSGQVIGIAAGVPAWTTPVSGSLTLLSTTSMAGVSTVTISSISQAYTHLQILVEDFDFASNDKNMAIRFNGDTGSNYFTTFDSSNTSSFSTAGEMGNHSSVNDGNFIWSQIPFYSNSAISKLHFQTAVHTSSTGAGWYNAISGRMNAWKATPAAITSITIFNSTDGTNFDAGNIKIYGVN